MSPLRILGLGLLLGAGAPCVVEAAPTPIIGCASLVNLRMLMRETRADTAAAVARLGSDQADHLGCTVLARDAVTAVQEHLTLNGSAYDCLTLRNTGICHWVVAGAVDLSEPSAKARPGDKGRPDKPPVNDRAHATDKAPASDKAPATDKGRR